LTTIWCTLANQESPELKNKTIERRISAAKAYHRNAPGQFAGGIQSRHSYDEMSPDTLTYWDDAVFIVNNYRVRLWWQHPRMHYADLIADEARKRVEHLRPISASNFLEGATANYKKLGRSRKKITSWTMAPTTAELSEFYQLLAQTEQQVGLELPFEVTPVIKLEWNSCCRVINLCAPFEVRSNADLRDLCLIAKRLVMRKSTLADEFGDRVYGQSDWLRDRQTLLSQKNRFFSHDFKL
jgi:hypothetical protein